MCTLSDELAADGGDVEQARGASYYSKACIDGQSLILEFSIWIDLIDLPWGKQIDQYKKDKLKQRCSLGSHS